MPSFAATVAAAVFGFVYLASEGFVDGPITGPGDRFLFIAGLLWLTYCAAWCCLLLVIAGIPGARAPFLGWDDSEVREPEAGVLESINRRLAMSVGLFAGLLVTLKLVSWVLPAARGGVSALGFAAAALVVTAATTSHMRQAQGALSAESRSSRGEGEEGDAPDVGRLARDRMWLWTRTSAVGAYGVVVTVCIQMIDSLAPGSGTDDFLIMVLLAWMAWVVVGGVKAALGLMTGLLEARRGAPASSTVPLPRQPWKLVAMNVVLPLATLIWAIAWWRVASTPSGEVDALALAVAYWGWVWVPALFYGHNVVAKTEIGRPTPGGVSAEARHLP